MKRARALFAQPADSSEALALRIPTRVVRVRNEDDDFESVQDGDDKYQKAYSTQHAKETDSATTTHPRRRFCCTCFGILLLVGFVYGVHVALKQAKHEYAQKAYVDLVGQHMLRSALSELPLAGFIDRRCHAYAHADAWGDIAPNAPLGTNNVQQSPSACCESCLSTSGCEVWVFNDKTNECWLKTQKQNAHIERPILYPGDKTSPWTTGALYAEPEAYVDDKDVETCVQVVVSTNGGSADSYTGWQIQILYNTFLQMQQDALTNNQENVFKHFTRLLHRTTDDELSDKIPTLRVDPRRPQCDTGCDFVVGDRADAFVKFSRHERSQLCSHLLIAETDYVFVRPLTRADLPNHGIFVGFSYGYIVPDYPANVELNKRFFDGDLKKVPGTGPAPGLVTVRTFKQIASTWRAVNERVDADEDAVRVHGWVRDMVSFSFALAQLNITSFIASVPYNKLMVQIPADHTLGDACIIHWTWGPQIYLDGAIVWQYDKRSVRGNALTPIPEMPAWDPRMRLQANETVTPGIYDLLRLFQKTYNRGLVEFQSNIN